MLALGLVLVASRLPDEFTDQLARLAAPRAEERAAAERWLEANLAYERYPEIAEAALAGDAEVRGRLARVLSSDDRHLSLALALCAEPDPGLKELGRGAVRAGVARAEPRLAEPPLREGLEFVLQRAAERSAPRHLSLAPASDLEGLLEELELVGELPLGLTLDASAASKTFRRAEALPNAPWNQLLWRLRDLGVELECHGLARGAAAEVPVGIFLRFAADLGPPRPGVDWVCDWLLALATERDEEARARAARNLASSGFTPALEWMDLLVRTRGDRAAREGLLRAAARGRVAPVLVEPEVLRPLFAEAEAAAGPRSARILCALSRAGCFDAGGNALVAQLFADFAGASARGRWARLAWVERNRCAAPEALAAARALLADPATPAALALRALHVCVAIGPAEGGEELRIAGLPGLFALALDEREAERLARALVFLRVPPPCRDPAAIPREWGAAPRAGLLEAWLWNGAVEVAAAHLAAWLQGPAGESRARGEALAEALQRWRVRGQDALVERALRTAGERSPATAVAIERVRLLLGLVPPEEVPAVLERGGHVLGGSAADLALVGALAGYPVPIAAEAAARDALRAELTAALSQNRSVAACEALLAALEWAVQGLYSAGRDEQGQALANAVRQAVRRNEKAPLARALDPRTWPPVPRIELLDVPRALARFEIPASL